VLQTPGTKQCRPVNEAVVLSSINKSQTLRENGPLFIVVDSFNFYRSNHQALEHPYVRISAAILVIPITSSSFRPPEVRYTEYLIALAASGLNKFCIHQNHQIVPGVRGLGEITLRPTISECYYPDP